MTLKIMRKWQDLSPNDFDEAVRMAEAIFCFVPIAEGIGDWLQLDKEHAFSFSSSAREIAERGVTILIHANWDGEELMIGGGGLDLGPAFRAESDRVNKLIKASERKLRRKHSPDNPNACPICAPCRCEVARRKEQRR